MTRPLAVVCAAPPGINPGMESVDEALAILAQRHGFADCVRFYRLYPPDSARAVPARADSPSNRYHVLGDVRELAAQTRAILYWGDFFHMWQYQRAVANVLLHRGLASDIDAALQRARDVFLLEGVPDSVLQQAVSFGGTLLFNTLRDEQRPHYGAALRRFVSGCRAIWLRDVYSAFTAARLRGDYEASSLCTDCAALLKVEGPPRLPDSATVGIFVGRSRHQADAIAAFAADLAQVLGRRPQWQPWGDGKAFPTLAAAFASPAVQELPGFTQEPAHDTATALEGLTRHHCIVTDTYHICVNAWCQGVPAICLAEDSPVSGRSVNSGSSFAPRDKRYTFFAMYDALDFYIPTSELRDSDQRRARLAHVGALVNSVAFCRTISERIREHAEASERALIDVIGPLIAP